MPTFGENLRREREIRKKDLAELARETRIGENYLEALEENAFESLPGTSFGKLYIRAYAKVLGFDPEPLLADYEREQAERQRAEAAKSRRERLERSAAAPPVTPLARRRRRFQEAAIRPLGADATETEKARPHAQPFDTAAARRRVAEIRRQVHSREQPAEPVAPSDPPAAEAPPLEPRRQVAPEPEPEPKPKPEAKQRRPESRPRKPSSRLPKRLRKKVASEKRVAKTPAVHRETRPERSVVDPLRPSPAPARTRTPEQKPPAAVPPSRLPVIAVAIAAAMIVTVLGLIAVFRSSGASGTASSGAPTPPPATQQPVSGIEAIAVASETKPTPEPEESTEPRGGPAETPAPAPVDATSGLTISGFGVGTGIVDRKLRGEGDRFEEADVVVFQTRVLGGSSGDSIRHVWLRNGRVIQAVDLELGGSHWRTHSSKTLWGEGEWAVEARDSDGHVLARSVFQCVPRGS